MYITRYIDKTTISQRTLFPPLRRLPLAGTTREGQKNLTRYEKHENPLSIRVQFTPRRITSFNSGYEALTRLLQRDNYAEGKWGSLKKNRIFQSFSLYLKNFTWSLQSFRKSPQRRDIFWKFFWKDNLGLLTVFEFEKKKLFSAKFNFFAMLFNLNFNLISN